MSVEADPSADTVSAGVATFTGLSINKVSSYTLTAASGPTNYGPTTSAAFSVAPGAPTQLAFVQQPSTTTAAASIAPAVTVAVEDANGNVETGDNATQVTLTIGTNPGGGTLSGGSAVQVLGGIATFSSLSVNYIGTGYTLAANSSPSYTTATSQPFDIKEGQLALSCASPPAPQTSTCAPIDLPDVSLNGNWQTIHSPANNLYVTDNRGLATTGWSVSAYLIPTSGNPNPACANANDFCNATAGSKASGLDGQIPAWSLSASNITCKALAGNPNPDPQAGPGGPFSATGAVSLCSASGGASSGSFMIGATYNLGVPPYVYAGQYQGTVEVLAY